MWLWNGWWRVWLRIVANACKSVISKTVVPHHSLIGLLPKPSTQPESIRLIDKRDLLPLNCIYHSDNINNVNSSVPAATGIQPPTRIDIEIDAVQWWHKDMQFVQLAYFALVADVPMLYARCSSLRWHKTFLATKSHHHNAISYIFNNIFENLIQMNVRMRLHNLPQTEAHTERTKFWYDKIYIASLSSLLSSSWVLGVHIESCVFPIDAVKLIHFRLHSFIWHKRARVDAFVIWISVRNEGRALSMPRIVYTRVDSTKALSSAMKC